MGSRRWLSWPSAGLLLLLASLAVLSTSGHRARRSMDETELDAELDAEIGATMHVHHHYVHRPNRIRPLTDGGSGDVVSQGNDDVAADGVLPEGEPAPERPQQQQQDPDPNPSHVPVQRVEHNAENEEGSGSGQELTEPIQNVCENIIQKIASDSGVGNLVLHIKDWMLMKAGDKATFRAGYKDRKAEAETMCQPNTRWVAMLFHGIPQGKKELEQLLDHFDGENELTGGTGRQLVQAIQEKLKNKEEGLFAISVPSFGPFYMEGHGWSLHLVRCPHGEDGMDVFLHQAFHHQYSMRDWHSCSGSLLKSKTVYCGHNPLPIRHYLHDIEQYMNDIVARKWSAKTDDLHYKLFGNKYLSSEERAQSAYKVLEFDPPSFQMGYRWHWYPENVQNCRNMYRMYKTYMMKTEFEDDHHRKVPEANIEHVAKKVREWFMVVAKGERTVAPERPASPNESGRSSTVEAETEEAMEVSDNNEEDAEVASGGGRVPTKGMKKNTTLRLRKIKLYDNGFIYYERTDGKNMGCVWFLDCKGSINALNAEIVPVSIGKFHNCLKILTQQFEFRLCGKADDVRALHSELTRINSQLGKF